MNNEETAAISQANLQRKWEEEMHHLFMLFRGKFTPGTLLTLFARLPGADPETDFAWTQELNVDELRTFLDRLEARNKKREINPTPQVINSNGFKTRQEKD